MQAMAVFIPLIVSGTRFANQFHPFEVYLPQMEERQFGAAIPWRTIVSSLSALIGVGDHDLRHRQAQALLRGP